MTPRAVYGCRAKPTFRRVVFFRPVIRSPRSINVFVRRRRLRSEYNNLSSEGTADWCFFVFTFSPRGRTISRIWGLRARSVRQPVGRVTKTISRNRGTRKIGRSFSVFITRRTRILRNFDRIYVTGLSVMWWLV